MTNVFSFSRRYFSPNTSDHHQQLFKHAAKAILNADAIYITAGAGMGVDSGLPDFRGNNGFWRAYPPFKKLNIGFTDMANPSWFDTNPRLAWGFYGHRLKLYESTIPHNGYKMLLTMAKNTAFGYFVFTSNVDGHFFKAGYDQNRVVECHGSIHYLQCTDGRCTICEGIEDESGIIGIERLCELNGIDYQQWLNELAVDERTFEVNDQMIPKCIMKFIGKSCLNGNHVISRPNILMFDDFGFRTDRVYEQYQRLDAWKEDLKRKNAENVCVIEMGAGSMVPRVRYDSDSFAVSKFVDTFIRINVSEEDAKINPLLNTKNKISLPYGALFSLQRIFEEWQSLQAK